MALADCRFIELPKIVDNRGNLSFIESGRHIPFDLKRVYYIYDIPGGAERGGHAHRELRQFLIPMSGSFDVVLDDGSSCETYQMNRPHYGLYIPSMIWREIRNFSSGVVLMVLASEFYEESDYFRDYNEFIKEVRSSSR